MESVQRKEGQHRRTCVSVRDLEEVIEIMPKIADNKKRKEVSHKPGQNPPPRRTITNLAAKLRLKLN